MPVIERETETEFCERVTEDVTATVNVVQHETNSLPELEYRIPLEGGSKYWIDYTYQSEDELLDVWFNNRVFDNHATATAVYDALTEMGVCPGQSPVDRVLTDVDLESLDLTEALNTLDNALEGAINWINTEQGATETSMWVYSDAAAHDIPHNVQRELTDNLESCVQSVTRTLHIAQDARTVTQRVTNTECGHVPDDRDLRRIRELTQTLFEAYLNAWEQSSNVYACLGEVGETIDEDRWGGRHQDGYRDGFERAFEYAGHSIVHAHRQIPKVVAHQIRR